MQHSLLPLEMTRQTKAHEKSWSRRQAIVEGGEGGTEGGQATVMRGKDF